MRTKPINILVLDLGENFSICLLSRWLESFEAAGFVVNQENVMGKYDRGELNKIDFDKYDLIIIDAAPYYDWLTIFVACMSPEDKAKTIVWGYLAQDILPEDDFTRFDPMSSFSVHLKLMAEKLGFSEEETQALVDMEFADVQAVHQLNELKQKRAKRG